MTRNLALVSAIALKSLDFLVIAGAPDMRQQAYKQSPTKISTKSRILSEPAWILASLSCAATSGVVYFDPTQATLSRNRSRERTRFET